MAFSPDGALVATADRTSVRFWAVVGRAARTSPYRGTIMAITGVEMSVWDVAAERVVATVDDLIGAGGLTVLRLVARP